MGLGWEHEVSLAGDGGEGMVADRTVEVRVVLEW